ncbi:polyprenol monophosphomannose synthase [Pseudarthrobacter sp. J75]|uniref:polyprenol monophosphomannose synthase n=1 Tax=unclassified Pseudarthrobacter TaxID=2647000 RepID=UPI002E7FE01D|nr:MULTISPECIES: polyprenol monophosphomannose synthase [unclassified Pseudarthrobacter]MEE2523123.1 polyprenol monophosphomannose synthase [Pseudarthrobacter sp. J47]MEE2529806.1 polyprenol monophosphomannose synthase [Pseudarthrobacter sp. J75]
MRVLTIIPTYNELESLPRTLGRLRTAVPASDVLVVDDNSPDGTGQLADSIAAEDQQVHVLHRKGKEGLGAAYIAGFQWGLDAGYDVLVEMDADGSHQPEQLPLLLDAIEDGADLAMGSRWVRGGSVVNWPLHRQLISRTGSLYSRLMLGVKIKDVTGGYRAFRRTTLEKLNLAEVESVGYGFQVDLAWRVANLGLTIVERPITFVERELGASKMSGNIVVEAMVNVTKWGLAARWNKLTGKAAK